MDKNLTTIKQEYLDKVSDERVQARVWYFENAFEELKIIEPWSASSKINRGLLYILTRSYFYDIERLKDFHKIEYAEKYKIGAYTAKWLLKHRPIYFNINDPAKINQGQLIYVKERFAIQIACSMADIPSEVITPDFVKEAYYTFHYRSVTEGMLILWLKALGGSSDLTTG